MEKKSLLCTQLVAGAPCGFPAIGTEADDPLCAKHLAQAAMRVLLAAYVETASDASVDAAFDAAVSAYQAEILARHP